MKETDLAQHVCDFYSEGFEVFKEVGAWGSTIDIVLRSGILTTAIECKLTFGLDVIEQAHRNREYCNFSYVAVPAGRARWFQRTICLDYGIGILTVDMKSGKVMEQIRPKLHRKVRRVALADFQKENIAGVVSGRKTAFGNTVDELKDIVKRNPGIRMKEAVGKIQHHYAKDTNASASLFAWIKRGVITGIYHEKGKLFLKS